MSARNMNRFGKVFFATGVGGTIAAVLIGLGVGGILFVWLVALVAATVATSRS